MASLPLTKGFVALIDDADFEWLSQWKWSALVINCVPYACRGIKRTVDGEKTRRTIYLHRQILDAPKGVLVDHANGDTLDNRRVNIRLATSSQNLANKEVRRGSTGFRGVRQQNKRFLVKCGRDNFVGSFATAEEAARAYDAEALKRFGEFARLNFPELRP